MVTLSQLIEELFDRFAIGDETEALLRILRSGQYGNPLPTLASYLQHPNEQIQTHAFHSMMAVDVKQSLAYVPSLVDDPSWEYTLCYLLCRYGAEEAVEPLIQLLQTSADPSVRYLAAVGLGDLGDARAIPALIHVYETDMSVDYKQRSIRLMAKRAIEAIQSAGISGL